MDSNIIKITGGAEIEAPLENDFEYQLVAPVTTYSVGERRSNQDGTYTTHHKAKISGMVSLIKGDSMIRGKDSTKASQRLRRAIERKGLELGTDDSETFYQSEMTKIIAEYNEK